MEMKEKSQYKTMQPIETCIRQKTTNINNNLRRIQQKDAYEKKTQYTRNKHTQTRIELKTTKAQTSTQERFNDEMKTKPDHHSTTIQTYTNTYSPKDNNNQQQHPKKYSTTR